jgi:hypothetical protein
MTFNIDTDNDDTNRYFSFYKDGSSGSGTELLRINESGGLHLNSNANNHTVVAHGDPTDATGFESQNRVGATTVFVADDTISAAIYMPRQGAIICITAFSSVSNSEYPQPNTSGLVYVDCGPSRNISPLNTTGSGVGGDIVGKGAYTSVVGDCDNGKLTVMAGSTQGTFHLVNRESASSYRYQITFL